MVQHVPRGAGAYTSAHEGELREGNRVSQEQ